MLCLIGTVRIVYEMSYVVLEERDVLHIPGNEAFKIIMLL
jgi:hypothetical protein